MESGPLCAVKMARLATSAVQLCQRLQDLYPQKLHFPMKQSEQSSPFRRWTTGGGAGSSYRHHDHRGIYNKQQMSEGSAPTQSNSNNGGVARWSLGLEQLLADPAGAAAFAHFLDKEYAAENIRFWWSCEQYRSSGAEAERSALATQIWQRHLADGASDPVNVDAAALRAVTLRLHQTPPPQDLFLQAQKQIFNVMKFDSYPRFLRSSVHAECARADLRGLPPPYAPDNNKLKKTSSNASERRRSGSLLPWRTRALSRERDEDVVKSSQTNGQCSLCRVVLPDGATSVVGVDEEVTVKRLVDRLLQRRNLDCNTYDVILVDQTGEGGPVPCSAPSSRLGGRVARVERRVVLRVSLAGRAVAVRCRPARRLRHVLRPVLQRYWPELGAHRVLVGGTPLHPDTPVDELDGARVHVLEDDATTTPPPSSTPSNTQDDDVDSLSDMALRPDDYDDNQSTSRSSVSSNQTVDTASSTTNVSGACSGGGPGARVRAALRAGPPLHHHPPDFLENLRETQRQRLPARTPPPLPPKPRAPTLV